MEQFMTDSGVMESSKTESVNIPMAKYMKENGKKESQQAME
jgi:hypothetical protein